LYVAAISLTATQVGETHVVGEDDDDVGPPGRSGFAEKRESYDRKGEGKQKAVASHCASPVSKSV
jgi:hypothetical protein